MNPAVDEYIDNARQWHQELTALRTIVLDCPVEETIKWGVPCYTYRGSNVVLMHVFKDYCALLFVKGVLLADPAGILIQQTENTQASRQIRFTNVQQLTPLRDTVKAYLYEAIELEKAGAKVSLKQPADYAVPDEFQRQLDGNAALKTAFAALTPGRQRAYLLHFAAPKQAKTRESRIEKCIPDILDVKGLND
ncbi:YdeI/OmpD-associated family protein [Spirosoma rhododendri]|uniref:YdhG-like domain-containing protein n=1 Tax=Spirosoma rhododendri TaxID=2728024 RepID=A0A7L5DW79_9BACT|nr:DUF1801 domain-containing protein [Spirosoma rhododendri]QJD80227.1 hypothetical protein HH216_18740 [Spirosoma rhododendri]